MLNRLLIAVALAACLIASGAEAANRTAWTAGNGVGYTWTAVMAVADMTSLANGNTVLSSNTDITNQTAQDQFMDISGVFTVTSATPPVGAYIGVYLVPLNEDGATYGTGEMTTGSRTINRAPATGLVCSMPIETAAATTIFAWTCSNIPMLPGNFRFAVYNGSGAALSSTNANSVVSYRTYNINTNN
jgi:hypothetical protein